MHTDYLLWAFKHDAKQASTFSNRARTPLHAFTHGLLALHIHTFLERLLSGSLYFEEQGSRGGRCNVFIVQRMRIYLFCS